MKLEWLEAVLAVARTGSFSEAAEEIPCAQSTVSRHVKNAEAELGVGLFRRSSNSNVVRLTQAGEELMPDIERILTAYDSLQRRVLRHKASRQLPVTLGLDGNTFSASSKARLLSLLYGEAPEIVLTIEEFPSSTQGETIMAGKADAFLFSRSYPMGQVPSLTLDSDQLRCTPMGRELLTIAVGEKDAPAEASISLSWLDGKKLFFNTDIFKNYDPGLVQTRHQMLVRACLERGIRPEIQLVDRHLADIKLTLTAQGLGVFPCTIPAFLREYPQIRYVPVADAPYYVQYYLLTRRDDRNPALEKLTAFLEQNFQRGADGGSGQSK